MYSLSNHLMTCLLFFRQEMIILRVMLTCVLRAHAKIPININIVFNNANNLMFRELNTPQVQ
jgi:hypothetical protein